MKYLADINPPTYDDEKVKALVASTLHSYARMNFTHIEAFAFVAYMQKHAVNATANNAIDKAIEAGEAEERRLQAEFDKTHKQAGVYQ